MNLPSDHHGLELAPGIRVPPAAVVFQFSRGGGPGGQNVNKVNTHATLTLELSHLDSALPHGAMQRLTTLAARYVAQDPPRLVIHASDNRSQIANRKSCLMKLRNLLIAARQRPKVRRPTRPSARAKQRRIDAKRHRGQIKNHRQSPGRDRDVSG